MSWLITLGRELLGLFVDDVPFTAAIVAWVGAGALGLPWLGIDLAWDAPILFLGCVVILILSVRRIALNRPRDRQPPRSAIR